MEHGVKGMISSLLLTSLHKHLGVYFLYNFFILPLTGVEGWICLCGSMGGSVGVFWVV
jgi:hypothetical protein